MLSARHGSLGRLLSALLAAIIVAACNNAQATGRPPARALAAASAASSDPIVVPAPLIDPGLDLRAGPVGVPLALRVQRLWISAPLLGVGLTSTNVMDAPMPSANDPVCEQAFWLRAP